MYATPSSMRRDLVAAILAVFRQQLPLYADMLDVATEINKRAGRAQELGKIMHAAVRVVRPDELRNLGRLMAILGMHPVGFYDLRQRVGVVSTAFRPTTQSDIEEDGFRLFTSFFDLSCIDVEHLPFVEPIIARRNVFKPELLALIEKAEQQGGLEMDDAELLVELCTELFTRPEEALVSWAEYEQLKAIHKTLAQVVVSNRIPFNHLTPSVASVPEAHEEMLLRGIRTIDVYQGPVLGVNGLLRQTSCLAPAFVHQFPNGDGTFTPGEHPETFVEFEERLYALTNEGRLLYEGNFLHGEANIRVKKGQPGYAEDYLRAMEIGFKPFPRTFEEMRQQKLVYCTYEVAEGTWNVPESEFVGLTFEQLIENGCILVKPQRYEDFLEKSATGIFMANVGETAGNTNGDARLMFETALGLNTLDMHDYYRKIEFNSAVKACQDLGLKPEELLAEEVEA